MILIVAAIFWVVNSPSVVGVAASERILPIYNVQRSDKLISISFDAAWGNEDTQQLIDILTDYNCKATFFVVGDWVDKYPESIKSLSDSGNEIMNHSNNHAHFSQMTKEEIVADINKCNDKIEAITGNRPTLFRCPYGEYNDLVISTVNSMNMKAIQWDVDSLDWKNISANEITDRVTNNVKSGSIILFHNAALNTPEALPKILSALQSQGFKIVPVSELLIDGDYTIDNTGCQCPISDGPATTMNPNSIASSNYAQSDLAPSSILETFMPISLLPNLISVHSSFL